MTHISKTVYNNWPNCIELKNEKLKLIVTTDIGPRIIYCGTTDSGNNLFFQNKDQQGKMKSAEWLHYGGHRLWHSPQMGYRPNQPDNDPVPYTISNDGLLLKCPEEAATKIQKEMEITLDAAGPVAHIKHRIYNRGLWPIKLAPWALTMMAEGGTLILPIPKNDTWFMPNYAVSFWPWTRPNDHRFTLGERYMTVRQDITDERWFKIGYRNNESWGAYIVNGYMFVKNYIPVPDAEYPDYNSTFETYTDNNFLELETLGPLTTLEPGTFTEHTEDWHIFGNVVLPSSESEMDKMVNQYLRVITQRQSG